MRTERAPLDKVARIEAILALIPGRVVSYGQVADLAGLPGRARLVGKVLRETDKVLPWHRVLGAAGTIRCQRIGRFDRQAGGCCRRRGASDRRAGQDAGVAVAARDLAELLLFPF